MAYSIKNLIDLSQCKHIFRDSFQLIDDPSGNSFIENLLAPKADPDREVTYYTRTKEQDKAVGIFEQDDLVRINCIQNLIEDKLR